MVDNVARRARVSQPDQGHRLTADAARSLACKKQCLSAERRKNLSREINSESLTDILRRQTAFPLSNGWGNELPGDKPGDRQGEGVKAKTAKCSWACSLGVCRVSMQYSAVFAK